MARQLLILWTRSILPSMRQLQIDKRKRTTIGQRLLYKICKVTLVQRLARPRGSLVLTSTISRGKHEAAGIGRHDAGQCAINEVKEDCGHYDAPVQSIQRDAAVGGQAQPPSQPRKAKKTVTILSPRAMDERNRTAQMERLREQHVQMARPPQADVQGRSFPFGPGESGLILDSPSSVDDEADIGEALLLKAPDSHSPQWDMMPAETPRGSAVPAKLSVVTNPLQNNPAHYTSKRSVPASTSVSTTASMSSSSTATPEAGTVRALANESAEAAALMAAVENSIARQISLSREQRRLLRPLQAAGSSFQAASPSSGASRSSPGARNASDTRDGRVSETKSSTPTLIVHDPMNGQHPQHRKSERVVLEEDDV
ncbi:hypothetical protein P8C59_001463 [Phyllachora maydis]|uniref:Uncharacterized protein n=1 Tax=Phyllachora maydis TaxID=1825666 RepID=A0AAD9HZQ7_9PEZI|nr:hypothetical protein P8C59_001463 [Phyllachora maydis]